MGAAGRNFAVKIAAKPLQIETCILLTTYPAVLSLIPYDRAFHREGMETNCLQFRSAGKLPP